MEPIVLDATSLSCTRLKLAGPANIRQKAAKPLGALAQKNGGWTYPANELVVQVLQHAFKDDMVLSETVEAWYKERIRWRERLDESKEAHVEYPNLKSYQQQMVSYGLHAKRFINSDDRGLGKTLEALAVAELSGASDVLIVCPGYLKLSWLREIRKWTPSDGIVTNGERPERSEAIQAFFAGSKKYLIVNYEMIREQVNRGGYPELLKWPWGMIIFDEAHRLRGRQNQWTHGAQKLAKAKYVQLLTGNPIASRPEEIWQLLNILDGTVFSSYWTFVEYFCTIVNNFFGMEIVGLNPARLPQLQYMIRPYMLRRLKEDVAPELPRKVHRVITVPLEGSQKSFYKRMEKQMVIELENGELQLIDAMVAKHLRLQQGIANPALLGGKNDSVVERTCMDLLADIFEGSSRVVVGTWFVSAADLLEAQINTRWKVFRISATLTATARDGVIEAFKACTEPCVLLGTIRTMSEGLNIDECDHMIFCDKSWIPMDNEQFEDRIHRITSTRQKHYYHIVVADTVSADKENVLQNRTDVISEVLSMQLVTQEMLKRIHNST